MTRTNNKQTNDRNHSQARLFTPPSFCLLLVALPSDLAPPSDSGTNKAKLCAPPCVPASAPPCLPPAPAGPEAAGATALETLLVGSQKRKARKNKITHLVRTADGSVSPIEGEGGTRGSFFFSRLFCVPPFAVFWGAAVDGTVDSLFNSIQNINNINGFYRSVLLNL